MILNIKLFIIIVYIKYGEFFLFLEFDEILVCLIDGEIMREEIDVNFLMIW